MNVMLQFCGALTLRQQLDWKKQKKEQQKAFEMSCETEYLEKQLLIFSETWSPSFCIVRNCFDDFRTNLPKKIGRFHRKQNTKFPKRRRVRSKNNFLSAALLFSLVVTKKICFENFLRSLYLEQHVFFVQMQSHVSAALVFEGYVWYFRSCVWDVLEYRILIKTTFDFFGKVVFVFLYCMQLFRWFSYKPSEKILGDLTGKKTPTFQNDRWIRSKIVSSSSALFFSLVVTKKTVLRTSWGLSTWNDTCFCSNAESRFGCVSFRRLGLVLWLFTSCVWDVLWCRILIKTAFFRLSKTETFHSDVEYVPKKTFWPLAGLLLWL